MRGEHTTGTKTRGRKSGSSPHARGAPKSLSSLLDTSGIIPACAGSTGKRRREIASNRDHPRMRGEHALSSSMPAAPLGSSPHARGAPAAALRAVRTRGIIPACAGSTLRTFRLTRATRDHPRMRGEHGLKAANDEAGGGSSPHARGALRRGRARELRWRDHPRMRGEHLNTIPSMCTSSGSSPHARGAPGFLVRGRMPRGIIPACAGSTVPISLVIRLSRDHPRMRGEHESALRCHVLPAGSSPHARGARELVRHLRQNVGIIPACAGSTRATRRAPSSSRDHPRMRGEHSVSVTVRGHPSGSSPHARGALYSGLSPQGQGGIIPACAGSTQIV